MTVSKAPRDYDQWRSDDSGRAEDAAYTFGFHLITNCRDEAMATIPKNATPEMVEAIQQAVDTALHNVCDMLEGFWKLKELIKNVNGLTEAIMVIGGIAALSIRSKLISL